MGRNLTIAERLQEVLLNGKWIANTNFKEQILKVSWQEATTRVSSLNTIALLTFHINYYLEGILHFLNTGKLEISDKYSFDLPEITKEEDWQKLVDSFIKHSEELVQKVEEMDDVTLDQVFFDEKYGSYQRNLEAVIEHCYYHLGQVSLIRKMIKNN